MYAVPATVAAAMSDALTGSAPARCAPDAPIRKIAALVPPGSPPPNRYVAAPTRAAAASCSASGSAATVRALDASICTTLATDESLSSSPPTESAPVAPGATAGSWTAAGSAVLAPTRSVGGMRATGFSGAVCVEEDGDALCELPAGEAPSQPAARTRVIAASGSAAPLRTNAFARGRRASRRAGVRRSAARRFLDTAQASSRRLKPTWGRDETPFTPPLRHDHGGAREASRAQI